MMDLDDLHRLLDVVEGSIESLRHIRDEYVDFDQIADLCLIITEVLEYTLPQRGGGFLGINRSVLNRYESPRVFRRPFGLAQAAKAWTSAWA
uniref:hypothetical protein n=1 Tax=Methylobacterium sp. B34 TaxID=95563 RepID=UPI000FE1466E|nr:hypothetical protein [Methylobacterium sp. B34]